MRAWIEKMKMFGLGLLLGGAVAFPLGMDFVESEGGKDAALLARPLVAEDLPEQVAAKVQAGAARVLEDARVTIHEATESTEGPLADSR